MLEPWQQLLYAQGSKCYMWQSSVGPIRICSPVHVLANQVRELHPILHPICKFTTWSTIRGPHTHGLCDLGASHVTGDVAWSGRAWRRHALTSGIKNLQLHCQSSIEYCSCDSKIHSISSLHTHLVKAHFF